MRLTVLGATGATGKHVLRQAADAGHKITAVVRAPSWPDVEHPNIDVVRADVTDRAELRAAIEGSEAVLSGLGPRGRKTAGIAAASAPAIVGAMADVGIRRVVVISAAPVGPTPPGDSVFVRRLLIPILRSALKDVYADVSAMEAELARSGLDWTAMRPPKLTDAAVTGVYRTHIGGSVPRGSTIARADLAHAMLGALTDPATYGKALGVAY
ncbi:NAD(P)H-binding protein [Streptomyces sp. SID3343]|uniref:NAD(P)-dependent oxidoreductase n=1 Tax=Streptomyces sp. SID3343 TaxID=2690260 RepID=UPI00136F8BE8|nr:NAD(P)H-binding protein [Streptomyces sp. SID3343]MYW04895.1 NAD(P)H-binding protein [Streptomyces sp. SID3343]